MAESVVERAKANWKLTTGVYDPQKKREIEDLTFYGEPQTQWEPWALAGRAAVTMPDGMVFGERPHPVVDKIAQPVKIVVNQWRAAHLGITVHPLSEDANKDTAQVIQGLYWKWARDTRAPLARYWAFDRAVKAGMGYYFLGYDWDQTSGHPFDQRIIWQRVPYQSTVYFDPSATEMDWSDGKYVFWIQWIARDKFVRDFGKSKLAKQISSGGTDVWSGVAGSEPDWVRSQGNDSAKDAIMVAKYWEKKYTPRPCALLDDWSYVWVDGENPIPKGRKVIQEREVQDQTLMYYCLTGAEDEPLHESKWNGKHLPIVPVLGEEVQTFDDQRRWQGMVRPAKDAQRIVNYAFANTVEVVSMETKATHMVDPRQISKYRPWWNQKNIRPFPFMPYDSQIDGQGPILSPPVLDQVDSSKLTNSLQLLQQAQEAVQDSTSLFDASLGKLNPKDRSGRAILAQQGQGDEATGGFTQNFVEVSLPCEARIFLDLVPTICERPGRIADILDGEDKSRRVMFNVPYTMKGETLQRAQNGDQGAKTYDLRSGIYGVETEAGKSFTSRMQQVQQLMPELMGALGPPASIILAPQLLRASNLPGTTESADKLQRYVDHEMPFLQDKEGEELTADQLKSKLMVSEQQKQQLEQVLQQAAMDKKTDQEKQKAAIVKTQMDAETTAAKTQSDNETKLEIARLKSQTDIAIAELNVGQKQTALKLEAILGLLTAREKMAEEARLDDQQGAHEVGLEAMKAKAAERAAEAGMGHEAGMAAGQGMRDSSERAKDREQAERQGAEDRDFQASESQADRDAAAEAAAAQPDGGDV